jgi:hypothetical protein
MNPIKSTLSAALLSTMSILSCDSGQVPFIEYEMISSDFPTTAGLTTPNDDGEVFGDSEGDAKWLQSVAPSGVLSTLVNVNSDALRFTINLADGTSIGAGNNEYRAEITENPWPDPKDASSIKTHREEWVKWSYTWVDSYVPPKTPISIYQNHGGSDSNPYPLFQLEQSYEGQLKGAAAGEIQLVNNPAGTRILTGIVPSPGQTVAIVLHVVYSESSDGLLELWFNGVKTYSKIQKTMFKGKWPGNHKWGIYHHAVNENDDNRNMNIAAGHTEMVLEMRSLRCLKIQRKYGYSHEQILNLLN